MAPNLFRAVLPASDMDASDRFWSTLLELPIDPIDPTRHYLHTAGAILALVDPREHGQTAWPNPDYVYVRVPDLDAAHERARSLGARIAGDEEDGSKGGGIARRAWGDRSFYTQDPFGNPVCLIDDSGSDVTAAAERYAGKPIANLASIVLPTSSMGRAGAFYAALLALEPDTFVPGRHMFYCDSCVLTLLDTVEHAKGHGREAPDFRPNAEIVYFGVPDLEAAFEAAQKLGAPRQAEDHTGGGAIQLQPWGERSFYCLDPSGNPIAFVDDRTLFTGSADPGA
jgi:predicted enzyme related to lactoylglutathione lyase